MPPPVLILMPANYSHSSTQYMNSHLCGGLVLLGSTLCNKALRLLRIRTIRSDKSASHSLLILDTYYPAHPQ
jgi:hypothetical protein